MNIIDNVYITMEAMNEKQITNYILNFHKNNNSLITIETLLFVAYDLKKYTMPENEKIEIEKRRYQYKFRNQLIKKYNLYDASLTATSHSHQYFMCFLSIHTHSYF